MFDIKDVLTSFISLNEHYPVKEATSETAICILSH